MNDDVSERNLETAPQPEPAAAPLPLVVFGRDGKGKAHASCFSEADSLLAEKAAGLMGMRVLRLATDEDATLAAGLPKGKIFASGNAFVPFCSAAAFAKLDAAPNAFSPARPAETATSKTVENGKARPSAKQAANTAEKSKDTVSGPSQQPSDWESITVGSTVLAAEEDAPTVWYVSVVVAQRGEDMFAIRWAGAAYADEPTVFRRRDHLGLIPAKLAAAILKA